LDRDGLAGMTLLELVVVLALVAAMLAFAGSTVGSWSMDQRAATSARSVADAMSLARAEAIRTGSNHIVAFDIEAGLAGIDSDIVIVNDGAPATSNCVIEAGEIVHRISLEQDVRFGSDPALANGTAAPDDAGASGNQAIGSSFTDAGSPAAEASWVLFSPDGLPHRFSENASTTPPCDDLGPIGDAGGAIYLTNGTRDYAVVLSPLGTVRLHRWQPGAGAWSQ
jgi:type II secretory pathway pseudopilin PulG